MKETNERNAEMQMHFRKLQNWMSSIFGKSMNSFQWWAINWFGIVCRLRWKSIILRKYARNLCGREKWLQNSISLQIMMPIKHVEFDQISWKIHFGFENQIDPVWSENLKIGSQALPINCSIILCRESWKRKTVLLFPKHK